MSSHTYSNWVALNRLVRLLSSKLEYLACGCETLEGLSVAREDSTADDVLHIMSRILLGETLVDFPDRDGLYLYFAFSGGPPMIAEATNHPNIIVRFPGSSVAFTAPFASSGRFAGPIQFLTTARRTWVTGTVPPAASAEKTENENQNAS